MKEFLRAAAIRAIRTVAETLGSTIPAGFIITPVMIEQANWTYFYIILAWLGTGLLSGIASFLLAVATGLPEAAEKEKAATTK